MTVNELIEKLQESRLFGTGDNSILVRDGGDLGEFKEEWLMITMSDPKHFMIDLGGVRFDQDENEKGGEI